jgi:hypothetical protein
MPVARGARDDLLSVSIVAPGALTRQIGQDVLRQSVQHFDSP